MKKILLSFGVVLLSFVSFSLTAFAQGDVVCKGNAAGVLSGGNSNSGEISFDAHNNPNLTVDDEVDLSILGLGAGLAPGDKSNAACTEYNTGQPGYDHMLKGWAWSDNIGFISFSCEGGKNRSGLIGGGVACGPIDYGVKLTTPYGPAGDSYRDLKGYAWNSAFGWLRFDEPTFPGTGVRVDEDGYASGYAWTSAGVWVDFDGMRLEVYPGEPVYIADEDEETFITDVLNPVLIVGQPDEEGENEDEEWCEGRDFLCAEVEPVPSELNLNLIGDGGVKYADGVDGYYIDLYLKDAGGNPLDPDDFEHITLVWEDTVKASQVSGAEVGNALKALNRPWTQSANGGVAFKPISFSDDFEKVEGDPGHYVSIAPVTSYAPTSAENVSYTVGTDPAYPVNNESFVYDIGRPELTEPNRLILKRIEYGEYDNGVDHHDAGSVLPNGKINGVSFRFKPAIDVKTLYTGVLKDVIDAYRGIPVTVTTETVASQNLVQDVVDRALFNFRLYYAASAQEIQDSQNCQQANFNFHFLNNFSGEEVADNVSVLSPYGRDVVGKKIEINAVATLPAVEVEEGETPPLPCAFAQAPSLYTVLRYYPDATLRKPVLYYSNKLPKSPGAVINPSIVVHGNIYGQDLGNVSDKNSAQLVGNPAVDVVRETIAKNLEKYVGSTVKSANLGSVCKIRALDTTDRYTVEGGACDRSAYASFKVGEENVLYFKGQDVIIDLQSGSSSNRWVIVADAANIYINNSIDNEDDTNRRVILVALRDSNRAKYYQTGHGYLIGGKSMVLDATMIFDGSLFPYVDSLAFDDKGAPIWEDAGEKIEALNYQLLLRGAIYSDNTIGGADLDGGEDPKDYLLLGAGEVVNLPASAADRLRAQTYDLNYLRLFTLGIATCSNGLPRDQVCGACLTTDQQLEIAAGATVCGEKGDCNEAGPADQLYACNGINPFEAYDGSGTSEGDLVPPQDGEFVVEDGFDPVYIYYRAPVKDSFVFSGR